jgi:hypothetical protein
MASYIEFKEPISVATDIKVDGKSLGSNAFNSTTIPTNNNQLTNGAGYVTSSGNTTIGTSTNISTSGATVINTIALTNGVVTTFSTRTLTLGNLGYTGATNANYITNNNQLTNGAGYITSFTNNYINGLAFDTKNGDLIATRQGLVDVQVNLDGRYYVGTPPNYYLNGISKSGNTITWSVAGASNQSYTFGSNAFNSTTIPTNNNQITNGAGYQTASQVTTTVNNAVAQAFANGFNGTIQLCDCKGNPVFLTIENGLITGAE